MLSVFALFYFSVVTDMNNKDKSNKPIPKWMNKFVGGIQPLLIIGSIIAVILSGIEFRRLENKV